MATADNSPTKLIALCRYLEPQEIAERCESVLEPAKIFGFGKIM